jgi:probable addiction module antidote protein
MKTKSYKADLLKELKDPEFASEYIAQALASGEQAVFLLAIRDVVEASGGASAIARQAHIQRESLYKALSNRGNPRLTTLQGILKSVGLRIAVTPAPIRARRASGIPKAFKSLPGTRQRLAISHASANR